MRRTRFSGWPNPTAYLCGHPSCGKCSLYLQRGGWKKDAMFEGCIFNQERVQTGQMSGVS
jgi:hypothetical protein